MLFSTEGIVLRETKFNEFDKILTIFSKDKGKIQAIAKGARRQRSPLIASTQVFCYSSFVLYKGRNMHNISQGEVKNSFYSLREDLVKLAYGSYILELIDTAITEEEPNVRLFNLLVKTLAILSKLDKGYLKLVSAFELKYVSFIGYKPHIDRCVICNSEPNGKIIFSTTNGGVICPQCIRKGIFGEAIDGETLQIMKLLLYSKLENLEKIEADNKKLERINNILKKYIMAHVDKRSFKSLEFLKAIEK